jgi:excinuclease ABC subunit A
VLDLTVAEALGSSPSTDVTRALKPLADVGLDYVRLGQPVPTLSGGEAQRLKLAGTSPSRSRSGAARGSLFLFDEPTTGLHFDDIATLLRAFRRLLDAGHSLVVIEHNLDVIAPRTGSSIWGRRAATAAASRGGVGRLARSPACRTSHTGRALRAELRARSEGQGRAAARVADASPVYASAPATPRLAPRIDPHFPCPRAQPKDLTSDPADASSSSPASPAAARARWPSTSCSPRASGAIWSRSTPTRASSCSRRRVRTWTRSSASRRRWPSSSAPAAAGAKHRRHAHRDLALPAPAVRALGTQYCPACEIPIEAQSPAAIEAADHGLDRFREHDIELPVATLRATPARRAALAAAIEQGLALGQGSLRVAPAGSEERGTLYSSRRACPGCGASFPELDPRLFSYNSRQGWCQTCYGTGVESPGFDAEETGEEARWQEAGDAPVCRSCRGARLRPEALAVRFADRSIAEFAAMPVAAARAWFEGSKLAGREAQIARDVLAEIRGRLGFLAEVGLSYLSLDRAAPTLSGGEAQRIRLAAQLGSNLRGVCYILDEPTIGLHARDNRMLLDTLVALRDKGNTVVVVEHDEETIRRADHVVDLGPGAGTRGGRVVAQGSVAQLLASKESLTGRMLARPLAHPLHARRPVRRGPDEALRITGARLNNLRGIDVQVPLKRLVCVTGVSGSGKSTLVRDVLRENLSRMIGVRRGRRPEPLGCESFEGWQDIDRVLEVDQTPIGKTPRSCPATYVGFWDEIRKLFAQTPEARLRGWNASRFSFNTSGGRCEACEGQGLKRIEMSFLPDVRVVCDVCGGSRFDAETRSVHYRGRSIADVLAMSVDEAVEFFSAHRRVHHALTLLQAVGLGYLTLGQQSPTLSGGEAQRIKLVTELARGEPLAARRSQQPSHTLYVLDEPTIGLHMADVEKLIAVLQRLVDAGNSVVVIEHDLDVIAEADWILDLGPEGGDGGGRVVARGTPEQLVTRRSHTAQALQAFLARS